MTFADRIDHGIPNLFEVAPRLWRMGHPADEAAWEYLEQTIDAGRVCIVCLHDMAECGPDVWDPTRTGAAWRVLYLPIPPEEDKPWSVFVRPDPEQIERIVDSIVDAYEQGETVVWHCKHGRDRTGLVTALVGMRLLGWTKAQAWSDMLSHGFRWELPNLDAFFALYVPEVPRGH